MKKIFKNKQGFTLIELLVVIGILAVLAAIAIPSVAGLIDRANKSADNSNANEMTNAVERFVSEYELYKQDIASGTVDFENLDSAQGRVYNVTGIKDRSQITKFEDTGLRGKGVDLDSKYPANEETLKAVIDNYMKTSSSTYEPKQSDMQYYYSPECGRVLVGETNAASADLTAFALKDVSISNTVLDETEEQSVEYQWICLDPPMNKTATKPDGTNDLITKIKELVIKTVSVDGETYEYESGMTWREWFNSDYNTSDWYIIDGRKYSYFTKGEMCSCDRCNSNSTWDEAGLDKHLKTLKVDAFIPHKTDDLTWEEYKRMDIDSVIDLPVGNYGDEYLSDYMEYTAYSFGCGYWTIQSWGVNFGLLG